MKIQENLKNKEILINDSKCYNMIGPGAVLEDCTLKISVPAKSLGIHGTLINTSVIVEKERVRFSWLDATLIRYSFIGTFKENEFGNLFRPNADYSENCVFTDAILHDCQFFGESTKSHAYPKWPHFVVLDPHLNRHMVSLL